MSFEIAKITDKELGQIKSLENNLGKVLLAVEPAHSFARLSAGQLEDLRNIERKLGCTLLAFDDKE